MPVFFWPGLFLEKDLDLDSRLEERLDDVVDTSSVIKGSWELTLTLVSGALCLWFDRDLD